MTKYVCEVVVEVEGHPTKKRVREWLSGVIEASGVGRWRELPITRVFVRRDVDIQ
jgi:hypothetical protein